MANRKYVIESGQKFGRLTIISEYPHIEPSGEKYTYVHCRCDCGNETDVRYGALYGSTKSCGCLNKENSHVRFLKHGRSSTPLYNVFNDMKNRCYRKELPDYKNWGGRGITICKEWLSNPGLFCVWAENNGYKKGLTIERIDNNKGYSPDNCKFVTRQEQCNNKRDNRIVEYNGEKYTMMNFCRKFNISYSSFQSRINRGRSIVDAMKNISPYKARDQRGHKNVFLSN